MSNSKHTENDSLAPSKHWLVNLPVCIFDSEILTLIFFETKNTES